jgi:phospholipase C
MAGFQVTTEAGCPTGSNMGYYDGNTVTALWNYARHFAMSDIFFDTEFGTTSMGHFNLISGQTHQTSVSSSPGKVANGSVLANWNAGFDDCGGTGTIKMTSKNVGDLLNTAGVSWGWFYDRSRASEAMRTARRFATRFTIITTPRSCFTPPLPIHIIYRRVPWI